MYNKHDNISKSEDKTITVVQFELFVSGQKFVSTFYNQTE